MMPFHSVDTQLGRKPNYVRQLVDVGFEKCELEGHAAAVSSLGGDFVPYSDKLLDVLQNSFELCPFHDRLRGFTGRTVPGNLDIARDWGDQSCPFSDGLSRKS